MSGADETSRLIAELDAAIRIERSPAVRIARALAIVDTAERQENTGAFAVRRPDPDAWSRRIFWRLASEVRRAGASRASPDGIVAAISAAIDEAREDFNERPGPSQRNPAG